MQRGSRDILREALNFGPDFLLPVIDSKKSKLILRSPKDLVRVSQQHKENISIVKYSGLDSPLRKQVVKLHGAKRRSSKNMGK